jgi:hypothetical protein
MISRSYWRDGRRMLNGRLQRPDRNLRMQLLLLTALRAGSRGISARGEVWMLLLWRK